MLVKDPPVAIPPKLWMLGTNAYPLFLVQGEQEVTIFEGGVGAMGPLLVEQMRGLGFPMGFVKQVVVTHAHPDHVMAVPLFRQAFPGIRVVASEIAAKTLAAEKALSFFCQVDATLTQSLLNAGAITDEHRPQVLPGKQIGVDRVVREGDTISVGAGIAFSVLETPGHSDCSLSFHEPSEGILIVSDATGYYMPEHGGWWPNYFTGYAVYLRSMERLAALSAEVLCLSHNGVIQGGGDIKHYFSGAILATREYHDRIIRETKAGKPARQIAEELGSEVHQKVGLMPLDFFQKSCGLLVKQSLRHEGLGTDK